MKGMRVELRVDVDGAGRAWGVGTDEGAKAEEELVT